MAELAMPSLPSAAEDGPSPVATWLPGWDLGGTGLDFEDSGRSRC
jgi:hypothetical protein